VSRLTKVGLAVVSAGHPRAEGLAGHWLRRATSGPGLKAPLGAGRVWPGDLFDREAGARDC